MLFYVFNICPKLHRRSYENYASHSSELSQLHQQPVDAVFIQSLYLNSVINCQAL